MKLESFAVDIHEILEDPDLTDDEREGFTAIVETAAVIGASIVNLVSGEIGEEEFMAEVLQMDEIDQWPTSEEPIEEMPIENPEESME